MVESHISLIGYPPLVTQMKWETKHDQNGEFKNKKFVRRALDRIIDRSHPTGTVLEFFFLNRFLQRESERWVCRKEGSRSRHAYIVP